MASNKSDRKDKSFVPQPLPLPRGDNSTSMTSSQTINRKLLREMPLIEYSNDASKADYGKLLIVAGSHRLPGPAILSAKAALRSGCGTVRVAAPASICTQIGVYIPELMMIPLPETSAGTLSVKASKILEKQYEACDAVVVGPGLDENDETNELCLQIVSACPLPLLIDAQALVALGKTPARKRDYGASQANRVLERVLTPHPGEMKGLAEKDVEEIEANREQTAHDFAQENGVTLVLKGRETLIAAPDKKLFANTAGTRGMGTAGSGDVLSGVIGALLAQSMDATRAAIWGVHLHAKAGELAAGHQGDDGMMATDFLERLPHALKHFREKK